MGRGNRNKFHSAVEKPNPCKTPFQNHAAAAILILSRQLAIREDATWGG
jgi:hypothetical protein